MAFIWSITSNFDKIGVVNSSPVIWVVAVNLFIIIFLLPVIARSALNSRSSAKKWEEKAMQGEHGLVLDDEMLMEDGILWENEIQNKEVVLGENALQGQNAALEEKGILGGKEASAREPPLTLAALIKQNRKNLVLLGLFSALTSIFQMYALTLALVAYVIAIKRTSVVFSVVWGHYLFKEKGVKERLVGAAIMVIGVFFIVLS